MDNPSSIITQVSRDEEGSKAAAERGEWLVFVLCCHVSKSFLFFFFLRGHSSTSGPLPGNLLTAHSSAALISNQKEVENNWELYWLGELGALLVSVDTDRRCGLLASDKSEGCDAA